MPENSNYIAVTIGPVLDTINLASSPSALWAASYMMSMLSKNICSALVDSGIPETDIVSPYFDTSDKLIDRNDGVGLFHDRVIFKADNFDIKNFPAIRDKAIEKTVEYFGFTDKDKEYFKDYFLVSAVLLENSTNLIMDSSKKLDCLELAKRFVSSQNSNPILSFYNSEDITTSPSKNDAIRIQVTKEMKMSQWQLLGSNREKIRSIPDIARGHGDEKKWKKYNYYAVVRSDGDRITKIIEKLKPDEIRGFSKKCMKYCSDIADKVHKDYGGVTIYSGGDDLLALMPVEYESKEGIKNIFEFTKEANEDFIQTFKNPNQEENDGIAKDPENPSQDVSLSFGIFVAYNAFPLYEALEQSADLLFGVAKSIKNCVAIRFQKHSGQSEGLMIYNKALGNYIKFHNDCLNIKKDDEKTDKKVKKSPEDKEKEELEENRIIFSAMHKFALYKKFFENAKDDNEIKNIFRNVFDSDFQKYNHFLQDSLCKFYLKIFHGLAVRTLSEHGLYKEKKLVRFREKDENAPQIFYKVKCKKTERVYGRKYKSNYALKMEYILRIIKFFKEKAGDGE